MSQAILERLKEKFGDAIISTHSFRGDETALVRKESLIEIMRFLKEQFNFEFLMDLTAVDYLDEKPRFEVVYHLKSLSKGYRLRIKVRVEEDAPEVPSLCELWKGANWFERECFEFYGIRFIGHPDLRHLLLYPEFEGFPLRKDYPHKKRQPRIQLLKPETR